MPTLLLFVVTSNQLVIVFVPQSTNMAFVVVFGLFVFSFNGMVCSKSREAWLEWRLQNQRLNQPAMPILPPCRNDGLSLADRQAGRQADRQTDRQTGHPSLQPRSRHAPLA